MLCVLALLAAGEAAATVRYVDCSVSASGDGLSWASAQKTVGEAIAAAVPGDEIWVADGAYSEAIVVPDGVSLYGGFSGGEVVRDDRIASAHSSLIVGSTANAGSPAYHVVTVAGTANIRIDGFTISGGRAIGSGALQRYGGGLLTSGASGTVIIANCLFVENAAPSNGQGGGAFVNNGSAVFDHCTFANNMASDLGGGWACSGGSPVLDSCVFRFNTAYAGGGACCLDNATPVIRNCTFESNSAIMFGGGLHVSYTAASVVDSVFLGNAAPEGGAVMGFDAYPFDVSRCSFAGNTGTNYGGGFASYGSLVSIRACNFVGNIAGPRGGGAVESHEGRGFTLADCVIAGNRTTNSGGGVLIDWQSCVLQNCTIVSNTAATAGGGLYMGENYSAATLRNVLFADNSNQAVGMANGTVLDSLDHCFFGSNPQGDFVWTGHVPALTGATAIEASFPQADGTVDGPVDFEPGASGVLASPGLYNSQNCRTTLSDANADFPIGSLAGTFLCIENAANTYSYVTDNTQNTITVFGNLSNAAVQGARYRLLDVHLGAGSAAVDRGASFFAFPFDIDGDTRGYDVLGVGVDGTGPLYDIGADERIDADTDGDGWADGYERLRGTDPAAKDTDGDGLEDRAEVQTYGTNPLSKDSDGDWFTDGEEVQAGSNPALNGSLPFPVGDTNHSGHCDALDVQAVINGALGRPCEHRTDINLSGHTDAVDVQLVINAVLNPV
jgi:hypothetical protein